MDSFNRKPIPVAHLIFVNGAGVDYKLTYIATSTKITTVAKSYVRANVKESAGY